MSKLKLIPLDEDSSTVSFKLIPLDDSAEADSSVASTVKNYGLGIVAGAGEGVANTEAAIGTFLQAPAANTLSGVLGARALADRGITAAINAVSPGRANVNPEYQESAQMASRFAAETRAQNAKTGIGARVARALEEDGRYRAESIQGFNRENNPELIRQQQATAEAEGFVDNLKAIKDNPLAFANTMARSAPDMAVGAGVAKKVAQSVAVAGGSTAAQVGAASTAGMLSEAGSSAMQTREGVYQQVVSIPLEKLSESPRFKEIVASTKDPIRARERLANELADQAPLLAGTGTALGTVITNRIFGGDTTAKVLAGAERTTAKDVVKNLAQESTEEGLQGGPEDLVQHGAVVQADPDKKFDVGGALAQNMAAGAAMGGGGTLAAYGKQSYDDFKRGGPTDGQAAGTPPADTPTAADVLGIPESEQKQTAAEKALFEPKSLTALDRVAEIDTELQSATPERSAELISERDAITKSWPATVEGGETTFSTEAGARVGAKYALIEAGDLVTSHDENLRPSAVYPSELQPRERDRHASEMQVSGIVQKLDPARLGLSADAATGAPIIGADGLVESGNARSIALKRIYQANGQKAEDYKTFIRSNAAQFGIDPAAVDAMQKPVLVRVRTTPVNRAEFARQANASTVAQMSPSEQARSDAARLDVLDDLRPTEDGDFSTSRDFIRRFMAKVPATEQAGMLDSSGQLSQTGYARIRNAVLAKAYGDSPVLVRMVESMDDNLRNIGKALMQAAPEVAKVRQDVSDGALFDADITPDLMAAVEELSMLRDSGRSVQDALAQAGMFGDTYSPETRDLLQFLDENIRRPKKMAEFIRRYTEALRAAGNPNQGSLLGETAAPNKGDLLTAAKGNEDAAKDAERSNAGEVQGTRQQVAGEPADAQRSESRAQGNESPSEWVVYPPATGTLGIPRAEMPQVKGDARGALIQFLEARGITNKTVEDYPSDELKPTQAEFSTKKTEGWKDVKEGSDRSVLISSDGYILDGHHQWMAALASGEPIKAIQFDAPIRELLAAVHQFPSTKRSAESASDAKRAKAREDFDAALAELGAFFRQLNPGVRMLTPEEKARLMPALVKLFEAGIREIGYNIKDLIAHVKKAMRSRPDLKMFWNRVDEATYREAAKSAVDNAINGLAEPAGQGDLFSLPQRQAAQRDLFASMVPQAPKVAMIDGRPYDPAKHNYEPMGVDTFMPADAIAAADKVIAKYDPDGGKTISVEDHAKAEALLAPVIKKAAEARSDYEQKVIDIAKRSGAIGQQLAPLKSLKRGAEKLAEEKFDVSSMKDLLRSTIVVKSYADAQAVMDEIEKEFDLLRAPKNRTGDVPLRSQGKDVKPEDPAAYGGYSDIMINVVMPNGTIAEIQINTPEMLSAKAGQGHKIYDRLRTSVRGSDRYAELRSASIEFYQVARATSKNSDSVIPDQSDGQDLSGVNPRQGAFSSKKNTLPSGNLTYERSIPSPSERSIPKTQPSGNLSGTFIAGTSDQSIAEEPPSNNDRDHFTLTRLDRESGRMVPVTFERGEYVRYLLSGKNEAFGEIDGISHAKREFSVDGLWYPFGAAYKADRPEEKKRADTVPLSSVIDKANAKYGEGLTEDDRVPSAENVESGMAPEWDSFAELWNGLLEGKGSIADLQASFATILDRSEEFKASIGKMKNDQLKRMLGWSARPGDKKDALVDKVYDAALRRLVLDKNVPSMQWSYGEDYAKVKRDHNEKIRAIVNDLTDADLQAFRNSISEADQKKKAAHEQAKAEAADPKTAEDFATYWNVARTEGKTLDEARKALTPEQRAAWDAFEASKTREARQARGDQQKAEVKVAAQTTGGKIVEGVHTKHGYPLWSVQLAEKVDGDSYKTLLFTARRMGGNYVNAMQARMWKTVWGFQFREQATAEAFLKLAGGESSEAQAVVQERRDSFADDRSQTAVERLNEMASRLDEQADESLGRERKANTERRARFAASAEASARSDKALATTMRNIADAIGSGSAKFLDRVRQKSQVEMLAQMVRSAKDDEIRAKYSSYVDQLKHQGEKPTIDTAEFATWPRYTLFRSDLATLGRQLLDVDGTKKLGQQLLKVADDVTDAYKRFAKENLAKVSVFSTRHPGSETVLPAVFSSSEAAERVIARSGFKGKATTISFKRGEHRVIMGPSMAREAGVWAGDDDQRLTLAPDFGAEIVEKLGRANAGRVRGLQTAPEAPWQFVNAYDKRKKLAALGIETPFEFRAALREFIGLQQAPAEADKIKQMERAMIGRRADGLDFFPTPEAVAQEMIDAAGIEEGMSVLEPSAGMGHIAEMIRAAGVDPDVVELSNDRKELLEAKGFRVVGRDFMDITPREFFTFGDTFRTEDGAEGVMRGLGGMGSNRVRLVVNGDERQAIYVDRDDLTGVRKNGTDSGYDRILMNPPFSDRRDAEHVQHAYDLLKPGGRLVAIMGEGVFFGQDQKAQAFREWLDGLGGTSEKLPEGSFLDPSLPVNTGVNARMVIIDKASDSMANDGADKTPLDGGTKLSRSSQITETIDVDGVERPTMNSNGQSIHPTEEGIRNFWRWYDGLQRERLDRTRQGGERYAGSKQVDSGVSSRFLFDEQGRPRVFYHGTNADISAFDLDHPEKWDHGWLGRGVYLGSDPELANFYARQKGGQSNAMPLYAGVTNPYVFSREEKKHLSSMSADAIRAITERAMDHGYDGGVLEFGDGSFELVAFKNTAVKSASGNSGDFDPINPNVTLSRGAGSGMSVRDLKAVRDRVSGRMSNLPAVNVLESPAQAPEALRSFIEKAGAWNDVEGALHDGEIYLFASGLASEERAEFVLATHEVTHYGLRGRYGLGLDSVLQQIWLNNANVRKAATALRERNGLGSNLEAVEEVLADMPSEALVKLKGWRKLVAKVRDWFDRHGFEKLTERLNRLLNAGLTEQQQADVLVADVVRQARGFVENGRRGSGKYGAGTRLADTRGDTLSRSAMKSVSANIDRGLKALAKAIDEKTTVHRAMFRTGLGWVDFEWGSEGKTQQSGRTKGGMGLSHILEARMRKDGMDKMQATMILQEMVRAIASGREVSRKVFIDRVAVKVVHDNYQVSMVKSAGSNGWIVTAFEIAPDARPAGKATATPTQSAASLSRDGLGAGTLASDATVPSLDRATRPDSTERGSPAGADSANNMPRLSRSGNTVSAEQRADEIIAKPAATARPVDFVVKALTKTFLVDRMTLWAYHKAGALIDRLVPERVKAGVVSDYGVPEAVIDRRTMMQGSMRRQVRGAGELIDKLATLTREESRVAYEWMNNTESQAAEYFEKQLPPESLKVMADVKTLIDQLSQEAVKLGQLDPEAFKRNRYEYLRRSYFKHTAELTKSEAEKRGRAISILGDQYKGRGMVDSVAMSKFRNAAPEWWGRKLQAGKADKGLKGEKFARLERRAPVGEGTMPLEQKHGPGRVDPLKKGRLLEVVYWPANEPVPAKMTTWEHAGTWEVRDTKGGDLVLWRDFTKQEREAMGEIDEARFAIAKTLHGMVHDVETGKYLEWLAVNHAQKDASQVTGKLVEATDRMRDTYGKDEWVQVPETTIAGTSVKKYGALAGRYLPGPIWNDVRQTVGFRFEPLGETYSAILGAWKTSKALALDTKIPTPSGWTTMGELRVGDTVFDEKGIPCIVMGATEVQHNRKCYEVAFSDGTKIVADAEHRWFTVKQGHAGVRTTDEIRATLKERTRGDANHKIPVAAALDLPDADLPIPPYALGAWLGDGDTNTARLSVGGDDLDEMLENLRHSGVRCGRPRKDKRNNVYTVQIKRGHNGCCRGHAESEQGEKGCRICNNERRRMKTAGVPYAPVTNQHIQVVMRDIGLLGNKHIPAEYLRASEDQRRTLLHGLMDTDGHVDKRGMCAFTTTLPVLRDGVIELVRSLGYKPTLRSVEPECNGKKGKTAWLISFKSYSDKPAFSLNRKKARLHGFPARPQRSQTRQIVSITPVKSVPVRCIAVSSKSRLYLAGDGMVPTHNTALSPAVHTNNVMANFVMADWHDVTAGHIVKALRLVLSANDRQGEGVIGHAGNFVARAGIADREAARVILERFAESGGNIGTWATAELQKEQLEPLLKALENEIATVARSQPAQVGAMVALQKALQLRFPSAWEAFKGTKAGKVLTTEARNMLDLYEAEDQVFRLASWLRSKEEGASDIEAGKAARKSFLDYNINAPWIQAMRKTAFPFVSFTYRAIPMLMETAATKPWKLLKLASLAAGLNSLAYLFLGGDGDEEDERRYLPEEKAGSVLGVVPKLIRMPWNDEHGSPVFLDIRRFIPAGDIFDTGATNTAIPLFPSMVPGGPLALMAEFANNKVSFTGKPITLDTDTPIEKAAKTIDWLYKAFAPNILGLPGTHATTGLLNAGRGKTDSFGREQSTPAAVASAFGIKLGSYPTDVLEQNAWRETQSKTMEIDRVISKLELEVQRNGIDQEEFESKVIAQMDKKRALMEAFRER